MILEAEQAREFYEEKYKSNNNENVSIGSGKDKFLFTRLFLFAVFPHLSVSCEVDILLIDSQK